MVTITTTTTTTRTAAAAASWKLKLPVSFSHLFLLLAILAVCLTSGAVASAQLHPSYNDRMTSAAHTVQQARARARAQSHGFLSEIYPGGSGEEEEEKEEHSVLKQLLEMDRQTLREAVLESVRSLSEEEGFYSSSSSSGSGSGGSGRSGERDGSQMIGETPADYHRCLNNTADILIALTDKQQRSWALKVLDAMGKPSPAVSEGNLIWPGAYDMCQSIRSNFSLSSQPNFSGRYCNAIARLPITIPGDIMGTGGSVLLGLCAPDTCSSYDLTVLLNDVLSRVLNGTELKLQVLVDCDSPNPSSTLDAKANVAIVLCSLLLLLMVLGTLADVITQFGDRWFKSETYALVNGHAARDEHSPLLSDSKPPTPPASKAGVLMKVLVAFSVYTNGSKLLSTNQPKGSLTCIHGIRFLSMTWVVLGHSFLFAAGVGENVGPFTQKSLDRWTFQGIANALVSVDSFFVISGLLVAYLTLNELTKKRGKLNWFMFYFHRFWRLTPAYMLVIMVYVCLTPYWGEGPFFPQTSPDRDGCKESWWTNLLYINNFVKMDKLCLGQSWYLANDMQFYCVLSPLVIIPLFYYPVAGYIVALVLVLAHCVTNAALTIHNTYPPGMFVKVEGGSAASMASWGPDFYMKPYTRWGPYVIGMMAGYFLHVTKCKLTIRWHVNALLWGVATASALAVLYGLYGVTTDGPITLSVSAFYNAVHRNVWGLCLCWVIIACVTGNGGIVNTILSWQAFIPLSRLTYCIYLLHIMIMELYVWNLRMPLFYTDINIVFFFLAVLLISYMAAAVASLAFEAPMMALEKIMLAPFRSRDESRKQDEQQNGFQQNGYQQNGGFHKETS